MFAFSAICDVPEETLVTVTGWLLLVLRWFRDDAPLLCGAAESKVGRICD